MREFPTGTITMLFSDIEGSTVLLSRLGDRYREALSAQRAVLRGAIAEWRGHEMGTEGDSFFVVFGSAGDAVGCCVAAQRALARYPWPEGAAVRVRMGLHSGEPARYEDGYVGLEVHRAARIAAAAHGGQVVLSEATRLLAQPLPPDVSLADLGWHRLKDIEAPERIFQLVAAGLGRSFPPLKSLGTPSSLPVPMTPLVGRDAEVDRLTALLRRPGVRLVTLTGTGGVGKTRLAVAAAAALGTAFPHGVFFVPLAAVRDPDVMWKTLAESLDVSGPGSPVATVGDYLSGRQVLLVLDNLEQLAGAAEVVSALLSAAAELVVLTTSRRPLHLAGEHEQAVLPLPVPDRAGLERVRACAAAQLFAQQAAMVRPGFTLTDSNSDDVAAICRRLDGLPLAVELAASRVKILSPAALLARLGHNLELAAADPGRPSRQQALRATIAWSYELLTADLQDAFRRAGVFIGGCDLDAFAMVALSEGPGAAGPQSGAVGQRCDPLEQAVQLLDVSLVTVTDDIDGEPRMGMLETIRGYALEELQKSGRLDVTRRAHAEHFAAVAERAAGQLRTPARLAALHRLETERGNLRAALEWSLGQDGEKISGQGRSVIGLRLAQALAPFWYEHGDAAEGRRWLHRALEVARGDAGTATGHVAHWLGALLQQQGNNQKALPLFEHSLAIWHELGERELIARELNSLAITHMHLGELASARTHLFDAIAIARQIGADHRLAAALTTLGHAESIAGNLDRATAALQEALQIDTACEDMLGIAIDRQSLAVQSLRAGKPQQAHDQLSATIEYVVSSGDTELLANTLEWSAAVAASLGHSLQAARLTGAAAGIRQALGMPLPGLYASILDRFLLPAQEELGPGKWDAEFTAGQALTQQDAISLLKEQAAARHPAQT